MKWHIISYQTLVISDHNFKKLSMTISRTLSSVYISGTFTEAPYIEALELFLNFSGFSATLQKC